MFLRFLLVAGILIYGAGIGLLVTGSKANELLPVALFCGVCFVLYIFGDGE